MKQVRQQKALARLEAQVKSGVKTKKGTRNETEPLTEKDKKRISGEIAKLKNKVL